MRLILNCLVALVGCSLIVFGQTAATGSLSGTVSDPSGSTMAEVSLTLTSTQTSQVLRTKSDAGGSYVFALLAPGAWKLKAERTGFQTVLYENVSVTVSKDALLNVVMAVGEVSTQVTVTDDAGVLQTQETSFSNFIDQRRVKELPLNGRNFQRLMVLTPGFGGQGTDQSNPLHVSINGARPSGNTYNLDGINFNEERFSGNIAGEGGPSRFTGSAPALVSAEAVAEFRVVTANPDAAFGRGSGAQVNIITKSGSNEWHGSAYEYLRNNRLDARDFFNTGPFFRSGRAVTPPFRQNLYGGSLGGPIRKNRHFFFTNYEGFRQRREVTFTPVVPNATLLGLVPGDLGRFLRTYFVDRNIVPAQGNPAGAFNSLNSSDRAAAVAAGFNPALFDGNAANGEAGTVLTSSTRTNDVLSHSVTARTDHVLTERTSLSARYVFARPRQVNASGFDPIESLTRSNQAMVQIQHTPRPDQVVEVRLGMNRNWFGDGLPGQTAAPQLSALGIPLNGYGLTFSGTNLPSIFHQPVASRVPQSVTHGTAMHSLNRGRWSLRTGLELRHVRTNFRRGFSESPYYDFRGFVGPTGVLGAAPGQAQALADSVSASQFGAQGSPVDSMRAWRSIQQEYFAQANYRWSRFVTLNMGLRYSYFGVFHERNEHASNLFAVDGSGNVLRGVSPLAGNATASRVIGLSEGLRLYQPDRNNFQPRLGIAWDLTGRGRSVFRVGYGLYNDRIMQGHFALNLGNAPFAISSLVTATPFLLGPSFPVNPNVPAYWAVDPGLQNPRMHQWNLTFEQALDANTSVSIAWVATRGRGLVRSLEPNGSGSVPQALRPDPRFSDLRFITNAGRSNYDALQIFARRRFASGLTFTGAFTAAISNDDVWTDYIVASPRSPSLINTGADPARAGFQGGGSQFVRRPFELDYGRSDYNIPTDLSFSALYELPWGQGRRWTGERMSWARHLIRDWTLSTVTQIRAGEQVYVSLGQDADDDGDASRDRPVLRSGSLDDLYARGKLGRTQYLIPQADAQQRLSPIRSSSELSAMIPRNALVSPRFATADVALLRSFRLTERARLQFEAHGFNILNRANFGAPVAALNDPRFGRVTATRRGSNPRQFQLALRVTF